MAAAEVAQIYRYRYPSCVAPTERGAALSLATFSQDDHCPYFYEGQLRNPHRAARLLTALLRVVQSRFHVPAAMLERILSETDPVVTCHGDQLRFEAFSGCCGVYARADLLPDMLDGQVHGRGTTNVEFNAPMANALARIRNDDQVSLSVGHAEVALGGPTCRVVEKKVRLPVRWIKGFTEVQNVQSRMTCMHVVDGRTAVRFLRELPRVKTNRRATWVIASGRGLRTTQCETDEGVRVGGMERLRVIEPLLRDADTLTVYRDPLTHASAWQIGFRDARFVLTLSPEVWRGFSGEGQTLVELAKSKSDVIPVVMAQLKWQAVLSMRELSGLAKLPEATVETALQALASRGLVGYDLAAGSYFHRELPFDVRQTGNLQPRWRSARKLVEAGAVRDAQAPTPRNEYFVGRHSGQHRVLAINDSPTTWKCSCTWYAKHQNSRGPCKHILAAYIWTMNS